MKKSYLLTAAAALIMVSCAENDKLDNKVAQDEPAVIGFSTISEKATRATVEALENYHTTFAVYASKKSIIDTEANAEKVFDGDIITHQDGVQSPNNWTYSPYRYWDRQANYTFFAVAPNADIVEYKYASAQEQVNDINADYKTKNDNGYTLTGQNLQATNPLGYEKKTGFDGKNGNDTDLMTADKNFQSGATHDTDVAMIFNHILAKLNVSIAKDAGLDNVKVIVTSVELTGLDDKGTYAQKNYSETTSGWAASNSGANLKLSYANETGYELPASTANGSNRVPTPRYFIESLVMPQSIENQGEQLTIKYQIISGSAQNPHTEKYTYRLYLKDGTDVVFNNFMDRNNYTLKFTIKPNIITFDASATVWTDNNSALDITPINPWP